MAITAGVDYNAETFAIAEQLRRTLAAKFPVELGRFSGEPVGPHPVSQFLRRSNCHISFEGDPWKSGEALK